MSDRVEARTIRYFAIRSGAKATGLFRNDDGALEYLSGDGEWILDGNLISKLEDPMVDEVSVDEANAIARSLGARPVPGEEARLNRFISRPGELVELERDE